jgi:hypothetical protein
MVFAASQNVAIAFPYVRDSSSQRRGELLAFAGVVTGKFPVI